jgi:hypothetical protein
MISLCLETYIDTLINVFKSIPLLVLTTPPIILTGTSVNRKKVKV